MTWFFINSHENPNYAGKISKTQMILLKIINSQIREVSCWGNTRTFRVEMLNLCCNLFLLDFRENEGYSWEKMAVTCFIHIKNEGNVIVFLKKHQWSFLSLKETSHYLKSMNVDKTSISFNKMLIEDATYSLLLKLKDYDCYPLFILT